MWIYIKTRDDEGDVTEAIFEFKNVEMETNTIYFNYNEEEGGYTFEYEREEIVVIKHMNEAMVELPSVLKRARTR